MTARKVTAGPAAGADVTAAAPDATTASAAAPAAPAGTAPASVAPLEAPEAHTAPETRAAALDALVSGSGAQAAPETARELDYDPAQEPVDFGGRTVCVVTFTRWNGLVKGLFRSARRGVLVSVTADEADRGERLGGLRRVDLG
jgi:hypothetical protein